MAEEELVTSNLKFVHYIIKKYVHYAPSEYEDLFQIGCIGLIKVAKRYNKDKSSFLTFSSRCILNEIFMEKRKNKIDTISLETVICDDGNGNKITIADMIFDDKEIFDWDRRIEEVHSKIKEMKPQYQDICTCFLEENLKQNDIASKYNVSQPQISRIIKKLKAKFKQEDITEDGA